MNSKIIIYDDDKDILLVVSTILKLENYEVICREDCQYLDNDLETNLPNLILMDNWLPDTSGVEATRRIKGNPAFKHIPVIFFSANSNVEELAQQAGADFLLKKPFNIAELQEMVTRALKPETAAGA